MRAVSLWQPWATAIALGLKPWETRSWATSYRGPVAIHASKTPIDKALPPELHREYRDALGWQLSLLPRGCFVAIANLVNCCRTEDVVGRLTEQELFWGDFGPGRWAWQLANVRRLLTPLETLGCPGLWEPPAETVHELLRRPAA